MKTINERASEYAKSHGGEPKQGTKGMIYASLEKYYKEIAQEQLEEDKKSFKEWIKNEFFDNPDENRAQCKDHPTEIDSSHCWTVDELLEKFEKDMGKIKPDDKKQIWVAADKCGSKFIYLEKPKKQKGNEEWICEHNTKYPEYAPSCMQIPESWFPELTWNDEPKQITISPL